MALDLQRAAHSLSPAGVELCWERSHTWNQQRWSLPGGRDVTFPSFHHKGLIPSQNTLTVFIFHTWLPRLVCVSTGTENSVASCDHLFEKSAAADGTGVNSHTRRRNRVTTRVSTQRRTSSKPLNTRKQLSVIILPNLVYSPL